MAFNTGDNAFSAKDPKSDAAGAELSRRVFAEHEQAKKKWTAKTTDQQKNQLYKREIKQLREHYQDHLQEGLSIVGLSQHLGQQMLVVTDTQQKGSIYMVNAKSGIIAGRFDRDNQWNLSESRKLSSSNAEKRKSTYFDGTEVERNADGNPTKIHRPNKPDIEYTWNGKKLIGINDQQTGNWSLDPKDDNHWIRNDKKQDWFGKVSLDQDGNRMEIGDKTKTQSIYRRDGSLERYWTDKSYMITNTDRLPTRVHSANLGAGKEFIYGYDGQSKVDYIKFPNGDEWHRDEKDFSKWSRPGGQAQNIGQFSPNGNGDLTRQQKQNAKFANLDTTTVYRRDGGRVTTDDQNNRVLQVFPGDLKTASAVNVVYDPGQPNKYTKFVIFGGGREDTATLAETGKGYWEDQTTHKKYWVDVNQVKREVAYAEIQDPSIAPSKIRVHKPDGTVLDQDYSTWQNESRAVAQHQQPEVQQTAAPKPGSGQEIPTDSPPISVRRRPSGRDW